MTAAFVVFTVVIAPDVFLILELVCQEIFHRLVCLAAAVSIESNTGFFQALLGSAADTAADDGFRSQLLEYAHQRSMALALGAAHFCFLDFPICQVIDLEGFRPAKMLENFSVFRVVRYGKFYFFFLLFSSRKVHSSVSL